MCTDFMDPQWDKAGKVHDWKNYVTDQLRKIWSGLSDDQKRVVASNFDEIAEREEWD